MFQQFDNMPGLCKCIQVAALLMLMISCGKSNPAIHGGNSAPVRVKTVTASPAAGPTSDSYSGTVEAGTATTPSFTVAGTITSIPVTEGQHVSKGQLLATIDGSSLKNSYEIALAGLREAQDAYARMKKLHDAEALPDMQWVSVQEKLKQAEAAAAIARTGMNDASLHAPISGVISRKIADVGQTAAPGIPIVEIMDMGSIKVKITVPEADLARMKSGAAATVTAAGREYPAKLIEKGVAANALSRNYDVKFLINKPDDAILPGMVCSVVVDGVAPSVTGADSTALIVLPPQAVVLDWNNESYVWLASDGKAVRRRVTTSGLDSRGIIVTGGLAPTDSVIVEGQQKLSRGLKVVSIN